MKLKKILAMAAVAVFGGVSSVSAQWTAPVIPGHDLSTGAPTENCYLYNVQSNSFYRAGLDWDTRATTTRINGGNITGSTMQQSTVTVSGTTAKFDLGSNNAYLGSEGWCWSNFKSGRVDWTFTAKNTNTYTFNAGQGNMDVLQTYGGGIVGDGSGMGYTEWAVIPASKLTDGSFALYLAKKQLYAVYQEAVASDVTTKYATELETALTAYNTGDAAAVTAAAKTLLLTIGESLKHEVNASFLFTNADLVGANSTSGWTMTGGTAASSTISYGEYECYHATMNLSQKQTVPAGSYRVLAHALYRQDGSNAAPYLSLDNGTAVVKADVPNFTSISYGINNYPNAWKNSIPNDRNSAAMAMSYTGAVAEKTTALDAAGDLTIALVSESKSQWLNWQGFEIFYTGNGALVEEIEAAIASAPTGKMNKDVKAALDQAITNATNVKSSSNLTVLNDAIRNANTSVAIYLEISTINSKAAALDASGQAAYASTLAAYNEGTIVNLQEAQNALVAAAKAQTTAGADMTDAIVNSGCDTDFTGWTKEAASGNNQMMGASAFEYWGYNNAATSHFNYHQTITGLPTGKYTVSANMYNDHLHADTEFAPTFGVYGITEGKEVNKGVDVMGTTFNWYTTDEFVVKDGTLIIGVKNIADKLAARWCVVDAFQLTYVRALNAAELEEITKEEALAAANEVKTTYAGKVGGVLQHTTEAYDAVVAIIDNASATSTEINAAVSAFNASVVAPTAGKVYAMTINDLYMDLSDGSNHNMVLASAPYGIQFEANGANYRIKDINGNYIAADGSNQWSTTATSNKSEFIVEPQADGSVMLKCANSTFASWGWYLGAVDQTAGSRVAPYISKSININYKNWKISEISVATMSCTAGKFGTFCAPFDVVLPGDVKAYSAAVEGDYVKLTQIKEAGETLTAGTPAIIYSEAGLEATTLFGKATVEDATCTDGVLTGILTEAGKEVPANAYVLNTNNGVQGFYKVSTAANGVLNRCYLNAPAAAKGGLSIVFDDDNTTAVAGVSEAKAKPAVMKYMKKGQLIIETLNGKVNAAGAQVK